MGVDPGSMAVKAALMAAQMALTMTQKIEGPRLDSLDVTTADYGTPLTYFWGKRRLEGCPIIWAEKLREKKTTSKTKGGKYAEYKYFGTFAVVVADHQIDAVSRIWLDKHICFDMTNAGPISALMGVFVGSAGQPVKLTSGKNMRIYLGNQTGPDPRMEAWCEDRYGADSCPAYKDVSYIVFQDIPLEKFGNRIPQVTVEAVNNSNTDYLWDDEAVTVSSSTPIYSSYYTKFLFDATLWDTATRTRIARVPYATGGDIALGSDGSIWHLTDHLGTGGGPYLTHYSNDGMGTGSICVVTSPADKVFVVPGANGDWVGLRPYAGAGDSVYEPSGLTTSAINIGFSPTAAEADSAGNVWLAGRSSGVAEIGLYCIDGPREGESHSFGTSSTDFVRLFINNLDEFVLEQAGNLHRLASDFTPLQTATISSSGTFSRAPDSFWRVASSAATEYSLRDLSTIRTLSQSLWSAPASINGGIYDAINHAIVSGNSNFLTFRFLDRVGSDGTLLADVVSDVAGWCGVEDFDVSGLDQTVPGYSVTQGAGKDMILPLLDIHDVDARPHDFSVQFITRGDAAAGTIDVSEFVREGDEARYTISIAQDTDLPRQISLSFADNDKDQQTNTVLFQRPNVSSDSSRNQQIDLTTYVSIPGDAQKFVDRYGRRKWNGRETVNNALTAQYLGLEPADVWNLALDDVTQTGRLTKITISQGRLNTEWERDFASLNTLGTGTGAAMDGRDDDVLYIPSPTKGGVIDIPLVQDSHDLTVPQLYYWAGNYGAGDWPGASIYQADLDGDEYFAWNGIEPSDKAVWGYATEALSDANPWNWDRANSVNVDVKGTLTSSTEAAINANPLTNLAMLGDEMFNFVTATLESDGTYTLSGLRRGRRGTEWATADHALGDEFVLVSSLARDGLGLSDVGLDLSFKAQTVGRDLSEVPAIEVDFAGNTLKPYAPARLKWAYNGTDLIGTITRRTRVGGAWTGGSTIPVSEATEAYEVDVYNGATLKRTISVSGTNTFTYTAAMAATDGITMPIPPTTETFQLSDAVGRGFALAA